MILRKSDVLLGRRYEVSQMGHGQLFQMDFLLDKQDIAFSREGWRAIAARRLRHMRRIIRHSIEHYRPRPQLCLNLPKP